MPVNFILVCPEKRQHFSPSVFFERDTDRYRLGRETSYPSYHTLALSLLTCEVGATTLPTDDSHHPWAAWLGSAAYLVTDAGRPDEHGVQTTSEADPHRNLYGLALDAFTDISVDIASMVCHWDERAISILVDRVRAELARCAAFSSELWTRESALIDMGRIARRDRELRQSCLSPIDNELARTFGDQWVRRYKAAEADLVAWHERIGDAKREVLASYY